MADKHPYVSTIGGLSKAITQFRSTFPATVNANTLKSLGIAPNNESYVINTFRFLGFIDDDARKQMQQEQCFHIMTMRNFLKHLPQGSKKLTLGFLNYMAIRAGVWTTTN